MARLNTFYLAPESWQEPFILDGEEAHHLGHVLRGRTGAEVRLFDGVGRSGQFCITCIEKRKIHLERLCEEVASRPVSTLILALGWSKAVRRGFLLEKAVELGAAGIWFWQATHSQGMIPDDGKKSWTQQMVAAAKQCGTPWLPEIRVFSGSKELIESTTHATGRLLCWEHEKTAYIQPEELIQNNQTIAVLGPEGGLQETEARFFMDHGFCPKSLGPVIMRFETAALFLLSLHLWSTTRATTQQRTNTL